MPERLSTLVRNHIHVVALMALACLCVVINLLPFFMYGAHPLGYDTGFYRRYLINPQVSVPNTAVPGLDHTIILPRIFLDTVRALGMNPDITLYGSFIFLSVILVVVFYFFVKEYFNKNTALISTTLLVLSPLQYLAYWFMLYKNFFALIFFFLTFIFLRRKNVRLALACALVIPLSHQSTTIIFLLILGLLTLIKTVRERKLTATEFLILIAATGAYLYLHPHVQQKIDAPPVGVFIEKLDFILTTLPLILFSLFGVRDFLKKILREHAIIAYAAITLLFPVFSLPYYQRIFLFTHYLLIFAAGFGIHHILTHMPAQKNRRVFITITLSLILIFNIVLLGKNIVEARPILSADAMKELQSIRDNIPDGSAILTSTRLTPWAQGWTTAKIYAPGILKDTHTPDEWSVYWSNSAQKKIQFLESFPNPLFIFIDPAQRDLFVPHANCVTKISEMLYRKDCRDISHD